MNRKYVAKRVGQAAFTVWAVVTITFGLSKMLPGDAEDLLRAQMVGSSGQTSLSTLKDAKDVEIPSGPVWQQYIDYWIALAQGNLGTSIFNEEPVIDILARAVPWTLFYISVALILTFGIGIAIGAIIAYKEGSRLDMTVSTISTLLNSVPYYVSAVIFVYILGYQMSLFPTSGKAPSGVSAGLHPDYVFGVLHHASLPILSIVVTAFGFRALAMRGNCIQILGEEYVRVADLRGLSDRRIALQYVGRNAVLPMYTTLMIAIGALLGGSVIIEVIFQFKGLGFFFFQSISARDFPLMMGSFLVISIAVALGLFIADLTYGFIDPRATTSDGANESSGSRASIRARLLGFVASLRRFKSNVRARLNGEDRGRSPAQVQRERREPDVDESLFQTTSEVTNTRRERLAYAYKDYIVAPARIIWQDVRARVGLAIIMGYVFMGAVGPHLVAFPRTNQLPQNLMLFQDMSHPLGSQVVGMSITSLIVHATDDMIVMMLSGAVFATVVATAIGIFAGYSRGTMDRVLMQISDVALTIPGLPLVMVLAVIFQPTNPALVGLLLAANAWGGTARQIRSQVLATGREPYVEASGIMSLSLPHIMTKDILPNIAPFVFVRFVQLARRIIISSVALYFLGVLPMQPVNWGVMLNRAYYNGGLYTLDRANWIMAPILAIVILIYGLILFAQGTDRIFNPRVRARHIEVESTEDESGPAPTAAVGDD